MNLADLHWGLLGDSVREETAAGSKGLRGVAGGLSQEGVGVDQWAGPVEEFLGWRQAEASVDEAGFAGCSGKCSAFRPPFRWRA